jgi:hypothetical protein
MARLMHPDGTFETVYPAEGDHFTLADLYRLIGCTLVDRVILADGATYMWLDDEGKYADPPKARNEWATWALAAAGGIPGDYVVGAVLVESGETE